MILNPTSVDFIEFPQFWLLWWVWAAFSQTHRTQTLLVCLWFLINLRVSILQVNFNGPCDRVWLWNWSKLCGHICIRSDWLHFVVVRSLKKERWWSCSFAKLLKCFIHLVRCSRETRKAFPFVYLIKCLEMGMVNGVLGEW